MDTKSKALELIEKIKKATTYKYQEYAGANYSIFEHDIEELKSVALIMVDEIIKTNPTGPCDGYYEIISDRIDDCISYWNEVKVELEKLK